MIFIKKFLSPYLTANWNTPSPSIVTVSIVHCVIFEFSTRVISFTIPNSTFIVSQVFQKIKNKSCSLFPSSYNLYILRKMCESFKWVKSSNGEEVKGAIEAGSEPGGVYIGQALHEGDLIPRKV